MKKQIKKKKLNGIKADVMQSLPLSELNKFLRWWHTKKDFGLSIDRKNFMIWTIDEDKEISPSEMYEKFKKESGNVA